MCGGGGGSRGVSEAIKQVTAPAPAPAAPAAATDPRRGRRGGSMKNVLTGPKGVEGEPRTQRKNLLGS